MPCDWNSFCINLQKSITRILHDEFSFGFKNNLFLPYCKNLSVEMKFVKNFKEACLVILRFETSYKDLQLTY